MNKTFEFYVYVENMSQHVWAVLSQVLPLQQSLLGSRLGANNVRFKTILFLSS